ncbi:T9SS type A sorting domain-containing protein [Flavobacterium terrae]|uniref:Delta-60 repeat domain-containing protein/Por secretion system C-terminal sorting domain-containing protein n=1 Tax=Flavobacterium terrae TaxID=415425 RepID=A0A1M6DKL7_9FLAO|nr:T9SS type A sorting domain-containing protein [Flavobacterium terrae]SHI73691.1 delta-60 repeat domain-containing protein/Por secretion system C-terminal sorting domain-containing protein [Flavobacterium terrae]
MRKLYALLFFSLTLFSQNRTIDNTFNPSETGIFQQNIGRNGVLLPNGKILTVYHQIDGYSDGKVILLNSDGSIDNSFSCPASVVNVNNSADYKIYAKNDGSFLTLLGYSDSSGNNFSLKSFTSTGSLVSNFTSPQFSGSPAGTAVAINKIIYQNDGKIIIVGRFNNVNGTASKNIVRLNNNGTIDTTFNIGSSFSDSYGNNIVNSIVIQNDGKYIVCGAFTSYRGTARYCIARINTDGSIDTTFNVVRTLDSISSVTNGFDGQIKDVKIQSNGKIIVVGSNYRTNYNIVSKTVVRLNADGTRDTSFIHTNPSSISYEYCQIQNDGKILLNNGAYTGSIIKRINTNGSNDNTFNYTNNTTLLGWDEAIYLQGTKLLVNGNYSGTNGLTRNGLHRINTDGSLDLTFNPQAGPNSSYINNFNNITFSTIDLKSKVLLDEKILLIGNFTSFNDIPCRSLCRLNQNGDFDSSFQLDNSVKIIPSQNSNTKIVLHQNDGKILLAFNNPSWAYVSNVSKEIIRLNSNGTLDNTFNFNSTSCGIKDLKLLNDGKILATGSGSFFKNSTNYKLVKLNANGTIDTDFNSALFPNVPSSIDIQSDNKIIVSFNGNASSAYNYKPIIRLNADGTLDSSFDSTLHLGKKFHNIKCLPDNKLLISYVLSGFSDSNPFLGRLNADLTVDATFTIFESKNTINPKFLLNNKIIFSAKTPGSTVTKMYILNENGVLESSFAPFTSSISNFDIQNCNNVIISGNFNLFENVIKNNIIRYGEPLTPLTPSPSGDIYQSFSNGQTLNNLIVTGTNITWYSTPSACAINNNITSKNFMEVNSILPNSTLLENNYTYYASQTINNIESSYRLPVTVYTNLGTDSFTFNNFKLFPNPVKDILTLTNDSQIDKIEIFNQIGQNILIEKPETESTSVNLSKYSKGIYFIKIYSNNKSIIRKIIKD